MAGIVVPQAPLAQLPVELSTPSGREIPTVCEKSKVANCLVGHADKWFGGFPERREDALLTLRLHLEHLCPILNVTVTQRQSGISETLTYDPEHCEAMRFSICDTKTDFQQVMDIDAAVEKTSTPKKHGLRPGDTAVFKIELRLKRPAFRRCNEAVALPDDCFEKLVIEQLLKMRDLTIFWPNRHGRELEQFNRYTRVAGSYRKLGAGPATNSWWFARHRQYDVAQPLRHFNRFVVDNVFPGIPPWLRGTTAEIAFVFPGAPNQLNMRFHDALTFERFFVPALLWERAYVNSVYASQFNENQYYDAQFQHAKQQGWWLIMIHVGGDSTASGGDVVLPPAGSLVRIRCTAPAYAAGVWKGRVVRSYGDNTGRSDLTVIAQQPRFRASSRSSQSPDEHFNAGTHEVIVEVDGGDIDFNREMEGVSFALDFRSALEIKGETECFSLRSTIAGERSKFASISIFHKYYNDTDDENPGETVRFVHEDLTNSLNEGQREAFMAVMNGGANNGFCILEGFPGTGKSTVIARIVIACLLMRIKILVCAHSRQGVEATAVYVVDELRKFGLGDLEQKMLRLLSMGQETRLDDTGIANSSSSPPSGGASPDPTVSAQIADEELPPPVHPSLHHMTMTERRAQWATRHSAEKLSQDFHFHRQQRARGIVPRASRDYMDYSTACELIEVGVLKETDAVFCTLSASAGLFFRGFYADVLCLDEAGQASVPQALITLTDQRRLKSVVFSGDKKQFGPIAHSFTPSKNPLGNFLIWSVVAFLEQSNALRQHVTLRDNFRSHSTLVELTSFLFYKNELRQDTQSIMDQPTSLTENIFTMLSTGQFHGLFTHVTKKDRVLFLDVPSFPIREARGTSRYNPGGINAVVDLVGTLAGCADLELEDISVITMYRADRDELSAAFDAAGMPNVDVSTVEGYQGRQRRVIVLHMVAANHGNPFGFISDPQRLNVALSRARDYLFIVGNKGYWSKTRKQWMKRDRTFVGKLLEWVDSHCKAETLPAGDVNEKLEHQVE